MGVLSVNTVVRVVITSRIMGVLSVNTVVRVVIISRIVYDLTNGWILHDRRPEIIG